MSKPKHTPTPWYVTKFRPTRVEYVHFGAHLMCTARTEADAARIVACVNACEGIADPSVVPELVAQLELVREYLLAKGASWTGIDAALAKAKGGTK